MFLFRKSLRNMNIRDYIFCVFSVRYSAVFLLLNILQTGQLRIPPPRDAVWQPVAGTQDQFYVYSAFLEHRIESTDLGKQFNKSKVIRIIGVGLTHKNHDNLFCRLWLRNNRKISLRAKNKKMHDTLFDYGAVFVLCYLFGVSAREVIGATVAVIAKEAMGLPPTNFLIVKDTIPKYSVKNKIHICVQPLSNDLHRSKDWMMEWVEFNRILGVSHFQMYIESVSSETGSVIQHYQRMYQLMTVLPWNLPEHFLGSIFNRGQVAANNDCLYRSMSSAGWILMIDIDELVVLRQSRTLRELLEEESLKIHGLPSVLYFRNAFFYTIWENDPAAPGDELTARKNIRWATPHPQSQLCKYLLRPESSIEISIHFAVALMPGTVEVVVPDYLALLHHYREAYEPGVPEEIQRVRDRTAHRYWQELSKRIRKQKNIIQEYKKKNIDDGRKILA